MKILRLGFVLMTALGVALIFSGPPPEASAKYMKETGKKCLDCHTKVPKKGATDPQLTELGKKFAENGHKLPK